MENSKYLYIWFTEKKQKRATIKLWMRGWNFSEFYYWFATVKLFGLFSFYSYNASVAEYWTCPQTLTDKTEERIKWSRWHSMELRKRVSQGQSTNYPYSKFHKGKANICFV